MSIVDKAKSGEVTVGDLVKNKKANFLYYRQGILFYATDDGFEFPIPIADCGDATFCDEHKATELMRWIRKQVDVIKEN